MTVVYINDSRECTSHIAFRWHPSVEETFKCVHVCEVTYRIIKVYGST